MLDKERKLLEGLVEVWGNDYKKSKGRVALDKYLLNFNKLDRLYEEEYLNNINSIREKKDDLFREYDRLGKLTCFIDKRLKDREYLVNNYLEVTGGEYPNYTSVALEGEFDNIRNRYDVISSYLDNISKLDSLRDSNLVNNKKLLELQEELVSLESKNASYEDELKGYFDDNFIVNVSNHIDYEDRKKLSLIYDERTSKIEEFLGSNSDILKEEELTKIRFENFNIKCQLMLFDINRLLSNRCLKYDDMLSKRMDILKLIDKRESLIKKYDFKVYSDDYLELVNLINKQIELLKPQIECINKIDLINKDIEMNVNSIEEVEKDNNTKEILDIRREYNLINNDIKLDKEPNYNTVSKVNEMLDKKMSSSPSLNIEEDIMKEEENLAKILKDLDIKVDKIPALDRVNTKSDGNTSYVEVNKDSDNHSNVKEDSNDDIPDLDEVIKALEKEYPNDLPIEHDNGFHKDSKSSYDGLKDGVDKDNSLDKEVIEDKEAIEDRKVIEDNNFSKAMDSVELEDIDDDGFKSFKFDENNLSFLNGDNFLGKEE